MIFVFIIFIVWRTTGSIFNLHSGCLWSARLSWTRIRMTNKETNSAQRIFPFSVEKAQQFQWLYRIVKAVIILNLLDSIFTLIWIRTGVAEEANIFLKNLASDNAVVFMFVKIGLVSLGSLILWRYRRHPFAVTGLFLVFMTYSLVLIYHLQFLSLMIRLSLGEGGPI